MHSLVRRYIKTAIVFLLVGLGIGLYMIALRELGGGALSAYLISAHTHAILVGFVMMMILGVALWMFPRPEKEDRRYSPAVAEGAYWMLTVGTALRIVGELLRTGISALWLRLGVVGAGTLQGLAIVLFFYNMWTRVRPVGSRAREAAGERF